MQRFWTDAQYPSFRYLRNSADSIEMNIDGSVTPVTFFYQSPSTERFRISRITIEILDAGIQPQKFAGQTELSTGLLVQITDGSDVVKLDFMDGETITKHLDFGLLAGMDVVVSSGAPTDGLLTRWTLRNATAGEAVELLPSDKIKMIVQDDLTGMGFFRAMLQGVQSTRR